MMDLPAIKDKCSRMLDALEAAPDTLWIHHTLVDSVHSLAHIVDNLSAEQAKNDVLAQRCDSLEKRYSELLYKLSERN